MKERLAEIFIRVLCELSGHPTIADSSVAWYDATQSAARTAAAQGGFVEVSCYCGTTMQRVYPNWKDG